MNPISLVYSLETLLIAVLAITLTQLAKLGIDIVLSDDRKLQRAAIRNGADVRKQHPVLSQVVLPLLPLLFGFALPILLNLGPDVLIEYAKAHGNTSGDNKLLFGAWGVMCGAIGDYLYSRGHDTLRVAKGSNRAG
jgi:hypothetical protein